MKVLCLNGSPREHSCTYTALREVADTLEKNGIETEFAWVGNQPVAGCIACGKCAGKGRCIFDDKVNEILEHLDEYDGILVGSPVYYAGPSVVSCRRGGASAAFDRLNKYFTICSMNVIGSQYWNQVHGSCPEDVKKDEEGLQTMRTLGENMAWALKNRKAGIETGIGAPEYEAKIQTSFIR